MVDRLSFGGLFADRADRIHSRTDEKCGTFSHPLSHNGSTPIPFFELPGLEIPPKETTPSDIFRRNPSTSEEIFKTLKLQQEPPRETLPWFEM